MRAFNLVKSLSTLVSNITSLPFREGLGVGRLILCLSLAVFGVNEVWGYNESGNGTLIDNVGYGAYKLDNVDISGGGTFGYDDKESSSFTLVAPGNYIVFCVKTTSKASNKHYAIPEYSIDGGSNWTYLNDYKTAAPTKSTEYSSIVSAPIPYNATHIRFKRTAESGNKTINVVFYVTMAQIAQSTTSSIDFGTLLIGTEATTKTFNLLTSNANTSSYNFIISTDAENVSISPTTITNNAGQYKTTTITLTYSHNAKSDLSGKKLYVKNGSTTYLTLPLSGQTNLKTAEITWGQGTNLMNVDEYLENPASSTNGTLDVKYTSSDPSVIEVLEGSVLHALKYSATPVTITAYQEESGDWARVEKQQTITVTNKTKQSIDWDEKLSFEYSGTPYTYQLSASASTSITYSIATDGGSIASVSGNTLTIKGIGKTTITATAAETDDYVGVSATRRLTVRDPNATCDEPIYEHSNTETLTAPAPGKTWETGSLSQEPRLIRFDACKTGILNTAIGDGIIVEEYVNGWFQVRHIKVGELKDNDQYLPFELPLSRGATNIRFKTTTGSYNRKFKNIEIYPAQYLESATTELNFTAEAGAKAPQQTFYINYSNIQGPISISCTDKNGIFSFPDEIDAECGDVAKNVPVTVDMLAQSSGSVSETLTLTDKKGQTISVTLKATVSKLKQSIEWDDEVNYKTTDSPVLTAKSSTLRDDMPVTYRSGDETIAQVNGSKVTFLKAGDVTIYANQAGNTYYEAAPEVSKVFHVSKVTPTIVTLPTVGNAITYGSKLSDVALTGGAAKDDKNNAVSGHFEWASPTEIPHGGQQNYTVRFVPENTNMYTSDAVSTETLAITVNKANQTLTWDVEDSIKIKKEDGNYTLTASSTSGRAITYTLSDPTLGTINGDKLTPLKSGDCTITAVCPPDGDYNASNSIEKKLYIAGPDEIVWKYKTGDRVWAGQNLNADGNLATAHTTVWFGKDETQGYLTVYNNTDPKTVYTAIASDGTLVTISATTAGDDYYALVSSSIQVYIDRCYQGLNWNQSFVSYTATAEGYIDETVPLTAVAVDSLNKPTNLPIVYSVNNADVAEITGNATDGWKLHIKGAGEATLTASVAQTNIYQGVTETRKINVRKEGERCGSYALISTGEKNINQIKDNTYTFDKPGETLTFKTRKYSRLTITEDVTVEGWNISNQAWERIDQYKLNFTSKQTKTYTINENIRKIRMYTGADIEDDFRYISDLYITQKSYLRSNVGEIDINVDVNNDFSTEFEISYSDIPLIQFNLTNDHETNLVLEPLQAINNDCGEAGVYKFRLSGRWDLLKDPCQETLTFKTSANDELVIPINVSVRTGETFEIYTDGNWNSGSWTIVGQATTKKPGASNIVNINANITVTNMEEAYQIVLGQDGKLTIAPNGGLTIYTGGISGATADNLIIESSHNNQGYLRISPLNATPMPKATVQLATRSTLDNGANKDATWQYVGIPTATQSFEVDYITWLYEWSEPNGWVNLKNATQPVTLEAWKGYAVTQYGQPTYEWKGQLLREDKTIELTCTTTGSGMNGDNLFANSYSSPIDVKRFTEDDFEGTLDKTFYIFNSGSWNQWNDNKGEMVKSGTMSSTNPGQYIGIPALSAVYLEDNLTMIAPMQGVYVYTETGGAKIKLNYTKHVWQASSTKGEMNLPLRAPQDNSDIDALVSEEMRMRDSIARVDREKCEALSHRIRISATSENSGADFLYVLEEENFTHGYDNGYEAPKIMADAEGVLNIYTNEAEAGLMSVAATNDVNEMFIGFNAGEDVNYELYITSVIGDDLELMDMQTGDRFALKDSVSYAFAATPNSEDPYRFRIFKSETKPVVPTGWTGLGDKAKIWYNKQTLYISDAAANSTAAIYTADGVTLKQVTFNHNTTISTADMPEGVYTVRVEDSVLKFFVKH